MTDTTDQSRRAQKAPLPPDVLADARHDKTHENSGRLLHASPIVVSNHAALLRDLDAAAAGVQRLDRLDAESAAKAIRGLAAKVAVLAGLDSYAAKKLEELRADRDRLAGEVERLSREDDANTRELRDICNALPGVAFMDPPDGGSVSIAEQVRRMYAALRSQDAEVARLTFELAAAREANRVAADEFAATIKGIGKLRANAERWCWMFPDSPLVSVTERMQRVYRTWDGSDSWNAAVDAARRAGEGEES